MTLWDAGDPRIEGRATDEDPTDDDSTWTVAELGAAIGAGLQAVFPGEIWLRGEIRSLRAPNRSGHQYFDLIEPGAEPGAYPDAKISVNLFRANRVHVETVLATAGESQLSDGVEVRIRAKVDWWVAGGQLRLIMSDIDPVFTLGQLDAQRRALLARLAAEGLLDANARRPLPEVPLRIGLVTSAGSAAHADFMDELRASRYAFDVILADARVQGADATTTLVAAIERLAATNVDVIAVVRGGGSRTDLVAFDHTDVAHAIARCAIPVFTGIGHEIDRSVADEVAHTSFKTPTAAAGALVARVAEAESALDAFTTRLGVTVGRHLTAANAHLSERLRRVARAARVADTRASGHLQVLQTQLITAARRRVHDERRSWSRRRDRLSVATPRHLARAGERADVAEARIHAADPAVLLQRGWSLTRNASGTLVRDVDQVASGDAITTVLASGTMTSVVTGTTTGQERQ